ncbi:MAG: branched-chain amino acid ABC transporter permease [Thermaerobacter sp.]|nr:branched-chain amino acid ABC transporter permease [Thermaerobacter sp.]
MLVYALTAGVLFGLFYSLVGLGLNLVFGVLRMVNLAHGQFVMLGGFAAYLAYVRLGWHPLVTMVVAAALFLGIGYLLYPLFAPRLAASTDPEMISLVFFFGVAEMIQALAVIGFGNNQRSIYAPVFGAAPVRLLGERFPAAWVVSGGVSLLALLVVYLYLYRSRLGYATRAVMASREEALVSGLSVGRISALAFGIGLALAAAGGALSPFLLGGVNPGVGVGLTMTAFAVVVLGSLGNPLGTVLGGLIYGVSLMLMQSYLSEWTNLLPYLLLLVVLLVRPSGLLGRGVRHA